MLLCLPAGLVPALPAAGAVDWQVSGYSPQEVSFESVATASLTIHGTFAATMEARRVKLGKDAQPLHDLTAAVTSWSSTQIKLVVPAAVNGGLYWVGIFGPGGGVKAKGPRTLRVNKPVSVVPDAGAGGLSYQPRPAHTAAGAPELEILNVLGFPLNACPGQKYPVSLSVRNNGDRSAEFGICAVGSTVQGCTTGVPQVFALDGGKTSWFAVFLRPDTRYIVNGAWKGRLFLGEAENPIRQADPGRINRLGSETASTGPKTCSTQVSTGVPGEGGASLPGWWLFCDTNTANHLREFSVPSDPESCPKRLGL